MDKEFVKTRQLLEQEHSKELNKEINSFSNQLKKFKLKNEFKDTAILLALIASAVIGRVALQHVPSVEPIIPLAIIAGLLFGVKEGFIAGSAAYVISNFFVWGLQGPWTIFQVLGAAVPGAFGGIFKHFKKPTTKDLIILSVIGTVFYEIIMNLSGAIMGIGLLGVFSLFAIPLYFLTSLPFSLAHIGSNAVFAKLFSPLLKLKVKKNEFKVINVSHNNSDGTITNVRMYKHE